MKSAVKRILPKWLKDSVLYTKKILGLVLPPLFKGNSFMGSVYYAILSRQFDREHQAVLAGKVAYEEGVKKIGGSSTLLRRNIHRLEKGLIMEPRRDIFAEKFIEETVKTYQRAISQGCLQSDEKKWFTDVLVEYFSVVKETDLISKAKQLFLQSLVESEEEKRFIPYLFDELPVTDIQYDELNKLFIKRRSVRWYQDKGVPMKMIEKAVNIATLAPSACNRQPYSFYVSKTKSKAVELAKCAGGTQGWSENIPCTIVVVGDLSAYPGERDRHLIYIDASLAAMQLMLALETLGLSTCAINWPDVKMAEQKMEELLGLKLYERPIMLLSVGYGKENGSIPYSQKKSAQVLIKKV